MSASALELPVVRNPPGMGASEGGAGPLPPPLPLPLLLHALIGTDAAAAAARAEEVEEEEEGGAAPALPHASAGWRVDER